MRRDSEREWGLQSQLVESNSGLGLPRSPRQDHAEVKYSKLPIECIVPPVDVMYYCAIGERDTERERERERLGQAL